MYGIEVVMGGGGPARFSPDEGESVLPLSEGEGESVWRWDPGGVGKSERERSGVMGTSGRRNSGVGGRASIGGGLVMDPKLVRLPEGGVTSLFATAGGLRAPTGGGLRVNWEGAGGGLRAACCLKLA